MKALNKEEIFQLLKQHKEKLKKYFVVKIGIFGSVLRGDNTTESDIDFIVEFEAGKKNYDNFIELAFLLERLLRKPTITNKKKKLLEYITIKRVTKIDR